MYNVNTIISGSYSKHFKQIIELKKFLLNEKIAVLAPASDEIMNTGDGFMILDEDPIRDPRTIQDSINTKIRHSSFIVVANIGGYIGKAAVFEMGYAAAQGIQILTVEQVDDPNLAGYCRLFTDVFPNWKGFANSTVAVGKVLAEVVK
jgi:nucleoside 2-deoxyribosyltransferase